MWHLERYSQRVSRLFLPIIKYQWKIIEEKKGFSGETLTLWSDDDYKRWDTSVVVYALREPERSEKW